MIRNYFTDGISEEGNKIGRVRPPVCLFPLHIIIIIIIIMQRLTHCVSVIRIANRRRLDRRLS